jgi:hypothetical protein
MKPAVLIPAAVLALAVLQFALAEDFKTIHGKEYKNATVTRVEPDGIVIKFRGGIAKLPFTELPKDVQERFHYDAAKAALFAGAEQAAVTQSNAAAAQQQQEQQEAAAKVARAQKCRIRGYVRRNTADGLVVELFALVSHNASDVPSGIHNPIGDAEWRGSKVVLLKAYPGQENVADGDYVDAVAYDSGASPAGTSTYRSIRSIRGEYFRKHHLEMLGNHR